MITYIIVSGTSMQPTVMSGQYVLVNRLTYTIVDPQRGDIIIFPSPINSDQRLIKRIIGLPSETIEFRATEVYIDGQLLIEPYLLEPCTDEHCRDGFWQLANDEVFVLGDNRNQSSDSRVFGSISLRDIAGQAILRYYPLSQVKWLD